MADQNREALEMIIGVVLTQSAMCEFLLKNGVSDRAALIEHFAARRVAWESSATELSLFPVDTLLALLAGRAPPAPPGSLH
jgi:hypothetical protein